MARSIEDEIRRIVKAGDFNHLSLSSTTGSFQAGFRPASSQGYRVVVDKDPVKALLDCLREDARPQRRRAIEDEDDGDDIKRLLG